jgi:hypothetical protein
MAMRYIASISSAILVLVCAVAQTARAADLLDAGSGAVTTFATGLDNPRGLKFGPDGYLYVAEGGSGGSNPVPAGCQGVEPPIGPYTGSETGSRISRIAADGTRTTVVDGLPSSQTAPAPAPLVSGVADVAFIGDTLYAVLGGAGCSHGVAMPNAVIRIETDGTWTPVADLSAYARNNPVANPPEHDFEPDGTWYSMIAVRGNLYTLEPNRGELVKVTPSGRVSRIADFSASQGHVVPSALAFHGTFYVGNLDVFPIQEGASKIYKVTPSGVIKSVVEGLTTVLGLTFDERGRMYALENTTGAGNLFPTPGTGRIVRISPSGDVDVIATGLFLPTAITFGPDGNLYVSNVGFGPPPVGLGEVLKIEIVD